MKFDKFEARNWLAHHHLSLNFAPLTIVCGPNGAGKSSISDGVAYAMMSELRRISAKGDRDMLVTDGQQAGTVELTCGGVKIGRNIANGKLTTNTALPIPEGATREAVQYLLDAGRFCSTAESDRRELLFKLPGINVNLSAATLTAELAKRGHGKHYLDQLPEATPQAWEKLCTEKASEARGAWKATTGENYGALKAETWVSADQAAEAADTSGLPGLKARITTINSDILSLSRRAGEADASSRHLAQLRHQIDNMRGMLVDQALLEETRAAAEKKLALATRAKATADAAVDDAGRLLRTCPHCAGFIAVDSKGEWIKPPKLPVPFVDTSLLRNNAACADDDHKTARENNRLANLAFQEDDTRRRRIAEMEKEVNDSERADGAPAGADDIEDANRELQSLTTRVADLERAQEASSAGARKTALATEEHNHVKAWSALSIAASPSGVAAEMLANGLKPLNDILRRCAEATTWPQVTIDAGMRVRGGGRLYGLMCESERWRVDAMMTVAIAMLSRMKFMLLDRFDVLDLPNRGLALKWLYGLTRSGAMDTVILMGTLKEPPKAPPGAAVHWLGAPPLGRP